MFTRKGHSVFTKHGIEELPVGDFLKGHFQVYSTRWEGGILGLSQKGVALLTSVTCEP